MAEIKESPEIIALIEQSRAGNERAYEELYLKYYPLLNGGFIKKHIKNSDGTVNKEEAMSILNLIFVQAVNSYKPEKSKFITHLTNYVKYKFTGHYLEERMMPFTNNATKEKIIDKLNKSNCILTDNIFGMVEREGHAGRLSFSPKLISFEYLGQKLDMPIGVFISSFIPSIIDKIGNEESKNIFKYYISLVSDSEKGISSKMKLKFNKNMISLQKSLDETTRFIKQNITFLEIKN